MRDASRAGLTVELTRSVGSCRSTSAHSPAAPHWCDAYDEVGKRQLLLLPAALAAEHETAVAPAAPGLSRLCAQQLQREWRREAHAATAAAAAAAGLGQAV